MSNVPYKLSIHGKYNTIVAEMLAPIESEQNTESFVFREKALVDVSMNKAGCILCGEPNLHLLQICRICGQKINF